MTAAPGSRRGANLPRLWSPAEEARLRELWPLTPVDALLAAFPDRSWEALRRRAGCLGVTRPQQPNGNLRHVTPFMQPGERWARVSGGRAFPAGVYRVLEATPHRALLRHEPSGHRYWLGREQAKRLQCWQRQDEAPAPADGQEAAG